MVARKPELEIVANAEESGIKVTYTGGHSVTVAQDEMVEDTDPELLEHEDGPDVWREGQMVVDCYAPDPPGSWETGYCWLETETDEGKWERVELHVGDPDADGHPTEKMTATYDVARLNAVERPEGAD
ncbi:hypothetical protein [Haloferax volcanii]|uniref:Uncharacterized protein n=1 Tax=Haloferax volcanii JCM 10717 TaxID=1227458 RepID=M0IAE9_HALVO|nr:hypothetical protein [Haloferax alexandrinus]ELZ92823.1 hypothetical protein C452_05115 [Haloferax alexandrinus JCM 10717]